MASYTTRLVTTASTNLTLLSPAPAANLHGWVLTNTAAYAIFVKFFWFVQNGTALAPTVGTTAPSFTLTVNAASTLQSDYENGLNNRGDLWVAATKLAADADTTALVAGDGLLTFILGGT
jgi:hypothetical protein